MSKEKKDIIVPNEINLNRHIIRRYNVEYNLTYYFVAINFVKQNLWTLNKEHAKRMDDLESSIHFKRLVTESHEIDCIYEFHIDTLSNS